MPLLRAQIVILNYNGMELLPQCLPSLLAAAKKASHPTTVTLLDNRSTDGSAEWAEKQFPGLRIVRSPENLFLVSFNRYLAQIADDVAILLNNDIRVDENFVDPLVDVFERQPDAFLASPETFSFTGDRYEGGRTRAEMRYGILWSSAIFPGYESLRREGGATFASGFGAFHRQRFLALGGYDDLYLPGVMEDADLGFRAWREGFRSYYVPESKVYHLGQGSFKKKFGAKGILTLAHRNNFLFIWKNIHDRSLLLQHLILLIPRLVYGVVSGKWEWTVGFFQALPWLPDALRRRSQFPKKRARSDQEIFSLANGKTIRRRYRFKKKWKCWLMGVFDCLGGFAGSILRRPHRTFLSEPKKILVIRTDSLGDAVLTLPAIHELSRQFPAAEIDFLVGSAGRDLMGYLYPAAKLHPFDGKGFGAALSLIWKLRQAHYDLGIDFRGDLRTILAMTLAGISQRWGREGTGGGFLLTRKVKEPYQKHELLEHLELVEEGRVTPHPSFPPVSVRPEQWGVLDQRLSGGVQSKIVVIHMGAGYPSKRWAASNFIELARQIQERGLATPVFIGKDEEKELLDSATGSFKTKFVNLMGRTDLGQLLEVLDRADLFIGNDSGPAHLAALLGKRAVVVFSGTNEFRNWAPWDPRVRIIVHPVPCSPCEERVCPLERQICLERISFGEVLHAVEEMLAG